MESGIPVSGIHFAESAGKVTYVAISLYVPEKGFFLDSN